MVPKTGEQYQIAVSDFPRTCDGDLFIRTGGHLRIEHSQQMAKKVTFLMPTGQAAR
jgi:hypothetical protein